MERLVLNVTLTLITILPPILACAPSSAWTRICAVVSRISQAQFCETVVMYLLGRGVVGKLPVTVPKVGPD